MVIDRRPSAELLRAGARPPCRIDEHAGTPVYGSGCEGSIDTASTQRTFDHASCAGWWPEAGHTAPAVGFRCSCDCHTLELGWPGWDRHLDG